MRPRQDGRMSPNEDGVSEMTKKMKRIGRAAATLALAVSLAAPATAGAVTRRAGSAEASGTQVQTQLQAQTQLQTRDGSGLMAQTAGTQQQSYAAQRQARLRDRIREVLRNRKLRFDNAERRITERIARVRELAGKVEAAGGDVSGVLNMLALAEESLAEAAAIEAEAVEQFEAVPDAADRRAAFAAARATGRRAVDKLRESRQRIRSAAVELRRIAAELRAEAAR